MGQDGPQVGPGSIAARAAEAVAALQEAGPCFALRNDQQPDSRCQVATPAPAAPSPHVASTGAGSGIIQLLQKPGSIEGRRESLFDG